MADNVFKKGETEKEISKLFIKPQNLEKFNTLTEHYQNSIEYQAKCMKVLKFDMLDFSIYF